jgi:putative oxidoreductase
MRARRKTRPGVTWAHPIRQGHCMADDTVDRERLVFPALGGVYERLSPFAYAFMRFCTGAVLVPHGIQKLMTHWVEKGAGGIEAQGLPFPMLLAWLTVFAESVAAICMAIGLFTRVAAAIVWIEMAVIITVFQWKFGYFWTNRGIEYALLWWLLCTAIMVRGGGRYSVDHYLGREF